LPGVWNLLRAPTMKCAAAIAIVSIAFVSQAFAVLRPLFPEKPAPPFNGELIMMRNDSIQHSANKMPVIAPR